MDFLDRLAQIWHYLAAIATVFIALGASGHAVLYKRESRAAVLWVGLIWLLPLVGAVLYLLLGVNRIRRRAAELRKALTRHSTTPPVKPCSPEDVARLAGPDHGHLRSLAALVDRVVVRPLVPGNQVRPLVNGEQAFPEMLSAIESAERSISLATYIFDNDDVGGEFAEALGRAVQRGVETRVIIDDTGSRYSFPTIVGVLRRLGVPVARFLPVFTPRRPMSINLRNHRKILVIDGRTGFTGGMNIRGAHLVREHPKRATQDLHFHVTGPVVAQLQEAFADDYFFCAQERLRDERWFPDLSEAGPTAARAISDGPDEDFEKLRWTLLGALSCARSSVKIVTPYFLPDQSVISALNLAAMRGVEVDIILPSKSNLPYVHWAIFAILWQVLERGCRVWLTPPPFDHSKLMLVDDRWSLIGSANWDARSLRLNFELNLECYGAELNEELLQVFKAKLESARPLSLEEVDRRKLPVRLRDGVARLLSPYL